MLAGKFLAELRFVAYGCIGCAAAVVSEEGLPNDEGLAQAFFLFEIGYQCFFDEGRTAYLLCFCKAVEFLLEFFGQAYGCHGFGGFVWRFELLVFSSCIT